MSMENIGGRKYVTETYALKAIGGGVVSKGQAVRHFQSLHPEFTIVGINSFLVQHETQSVKIKVLVADKIKTKTADFTKHEQKLLNPGYDEIVRVHDELIIDHGNLRIKHKELMASRNHLVNELAESEKQLLDLQKKYSKIIGTNVDGSPRIVCPQEDGPCDCGGEHCPDAEKVNIERELGYSEPEQGDTDAE